MLWCYVLKVCFLKRKESSVLTKCFSYVAKSAVLWTGTTCYTSNSSPFEAAGDSFRAHVLRVASCSMRGASSRANKTEYRIIVCSKQCHFHWWIWLFLISCWIANANQLLPRTPRSSLCYQVCCEHSIFHRCFLRICIHCSDGEGLTLRLFTCQLSPAVNGNIYILF